MKQVLIVEDDDYIRESLKDVLECEGYDVLVAGNGRIALDVLVTPSLPGLILLDLMMPVMNGWQFLDAIKNDVRIAKIPVIISSAVVDQANAGNVAGYVKKPYELHHLLDLVKSHCQ